MKFQAERGELLTLLTTAGRAVPTRSQFGAGGIFLSLRGREHLVASGADNDVAIDASIEVNGEDDGEVTLPSKLLIDIVKSFDEGAVTLAVEDGLEATVSSGRASFTLRTLATGTRWAPLGGPKTDDVVNIPASDLADGLRQVLRAASQDVTRAPQLTGVLFEETEDGVRLVTTDSYRLAFRDLPGVHVAPADGTVLVPAAALSEVRGFISASTDYVTLARDDLTAAFAIGDTTVTTRLLKGPFPDYRRLLPDTIPTTVTVDRRDFIDAVKRVRVMLPAGKDATTPVQLSIDATGIALTLATPDKGGAMDWVDGKLEGDVPTAVAFNPTFLVEALDAITGDEAVIGLVNATKPATLHGADSAFQTLIMPVRVA